MRGFRNCFSTLVFGLLIMASEGRSDIAFLGDSISTGGASHPKLVLQPEQFGRVMMGKEDLAPDADYYARIRSAGYDLQAPANPPIRLLPADREMRHPLIWYLESVWTLFGARFLDTEQFAWSYLLAHRLGYQADQILLAARDGERIEKAVVQLDRILEYKSGQLPEHAFVFFTGNDLCGPGFEFVTHQSEYGAHLEEFLQHYLRARQKDPSGLKHVWLMDPLGVLQIVSSQSILNKKVPFDDKMISCKQLQTLDPRQSPASISTGDPVIDKIFTFATGASVNSCPTLFAVHGEQGSEARLQLADRILGYRKVLAKQLEAFKTSFAAKNIKLRILSASADVIFEAEDMANDCFHINLNGHLKLAAAVYEEIQSQLTE